MFLHLHACTHYTGGTKHGVLFTAGGMRSIPTWSERYGSRGRAKPLRSTAWVSQPLYLFDTWNESPGDLTWSSLKSKETFPVALTSFGASLWSREEEERAGMVIQWSCPLSTWQLSTSTTEVSPTALPAPVLGAGRPYLLYRPRVICPGLQ